MLCEVQWWAEGEGGGVALQNDVVTKSTLEVYGGYCGIAVI